MERTMKRSKVPTNTIKVNPNMVLHIHTHFIFAFDQELSDTSLVTDKRKSNDENIGANGNVNVTKQFKLRNKRVEYKDGTTKKFVLESINDQIPKRARTAKRTPSVVLNEDSGLSGSDGMP